MTKIYSPPWRRDKHYFPTLIVFASFSIINPLLHLRTWWSTSRIDTKKKKKYSRSLSTTGPPHHQYRVERPNKGGWTLQWWNDDGRTRSEEIEFMTTIDLDWCNYFFFGKGEEFQFPQMAHLVLRLQLRLLRSARGNIDGWTQFSTTDAYSLYWWLVEWHYE